MDFSIVLAKGLLVQVGPARLNFSVSGENHDPPHVVQRFNFMTKSGMIKQVGEKKYPFQMGEWNSFNSKSKNKSVVFFLPPVSYLL